MRHIDVDLIVVLSLQFIHHIINDGFFELHENDNSTIFVICTMVFVAIYAFEINITTYFFHDIVFIVFMIICIIC